MSVLRLHFQLYNAGREKEEQISYFDLIWNRELWAKYLNYCKIRISKSEWLESDLRTFYGYIYIYNL